MNQPVTGTSKTVCFLGEGSKTHNLLRAAIKLGCKTIVWTSRKGNHTRVKGARYVIQPYDCKTTFTEVIETADVITVGSDDFPVELIKQLEKEGKKKQGNLVRLSSDVLALTQHYLPARRMAWQMCIMTPTTICLPRGEAWPLTWKSGLPGTLEMNAVTKDARKRRIKTGQALRKACDSVSGDCLLERLTEGCVKLTIWVARSPLGEIKVYGANQVLQGVATQIAERLKLEGLLGLKFLIDANGSVFFDRMNTCLHSPFSKPSGVTSVNQYVQHIRAICDFPLS